MHVSHFLLVYYAIILWYTCNDTHTLIKLYTSLLVMQLSLINRRSTGGERSAMMTGGGHRLAGSRVQFSGVGRRSARGRGRGWGRGVGSALVGVASPERAPALMRELSVPSQQSASPTHEKSIAVKKVHNHVLRVCMIYHLCGKISILPSPLCCRKIWIFANTYSMQSLIQDKKFMQ